jgi:hypothetical protein
MSGKIEGLLAWEDPNRHSGDFPEAAAGSINEDSGRFIGQADD